MQGGIVGTVIGRVGQMQRHALAPRFQRRRRREVQMLVLRICSVLRQPAKLGLPR